MSSFDVSMHGKTLNFSAGGERNARRPGGVRSEGGVRSDNLSLECDKHDDAGRQRPTDAARVEQADKPGRLEKADKFLGIGKPWTRSTGLPFSGAPISLSRASVVTFVQVACVAGIAFEAALESNYTLQSILRRCAVVALCCFVPVEHIAPFHAAVCALCTQVGEPLQHGAVSPATLGGAIFATLHRGALHHPRTWLVLMLACATCSVLVSTLLLGQLLPQHQWWSELILLALSASAYVVLHTTDNRGK